MLTFILTVLMVGPMLIVRYYQVLMNNPHFVLPAGIGTGAGIFFWFLKKRKRVER